MNPWWQYLPVAFSVLWVFALGLGVGSFLNVVVARVPYQKSVVWPGSRCFSCLRPIRFRDNLPIVGYLRLRGRCRDCGATFSSRYLWVEVGTGAAFVLLFVLEVLSQARPAAIPGLHPWHFMPGAEWNLWQNGGLPPARLWVLYFFHAALVALLLAASLIDAEHRIIPLSITYGGTALGLLGSALFPWPWPNSPGDVNLPFGWPAPAGDIPTGMMLWPFMGPPPTWAPLGSWQLGLLNGLAGAAVGMGVGRAVKGLFETGMGKEALGLGDADLLMMAGAFLGWQPAALALPLAACLTLPVVLPPKIWGWLRGRNVESELPFGPGIAAGAVVAWLGWPWFGPAVRPLFDLVLVGFVAVVMGGGMLAAGLMLRRGGAD